MCCRTKCFERFFCCCFVFSKLISFTVHYSLSASHGLFVVLLYLTFTLSLDLCSKFAYIHIPCTLVLALLIINTIACNSCTFSSPFLLCVCYRSSPLVFHVYVRVWSSFYHVGSRDRNQGVRLYLVIPVIHVFGRPLFQLIQLWLLHLHPPPPITSNKQRKQNLRVQMWWHMPYPSNLGSGGWGRGIVDSGQLGYMMRSCQNHENKQNGGASLLAS